jgi:methionine aminopeptidase
VGEIDEESKKLIRACRESLDASIKLCKPGALFRDIGKAMYVVTVCYLFDFSLCSIPVSLLPEAMDVL